MSWRPRRFWTAVSVEPVAAGHAIRLDGRPVRTPGRVEIALPTRAFAEAVAAEWTAQGDEIRPETMPLTRAANSAIDTLSQHRAAVAGDLAGYGGSDLLCYRAEGPRALVERQAEAWDPLLDWAQDELGAPLIVTRGVMHRDQPAASLERLAARVEALDIFRLAAFHDLVMLSGSLVIALAVMAGRLTPEAGWAASRIDEDWQIEQWGPDDEAERQTAARHRAFLDAARLMALLDTHD